MSVLLGTRARNDGGGELSVDVYPALHPAGGIGRYVRDVCEALQRNTGALPWRLAFPRNLGSTARSRYPEALHRELPVGWLGLRLLVAFGQPLGLRFDRMYGNPAVVHSPLGYGPLFSRARLIVNVHDLTFLEHPEWHPLRTSLFYRATLPPAARAASRVIFHSEFVRRTAIEHLRIRPERTLLLPPPLGHGFHAMPQSEARAQAAQRFGLGGDFILHVGTIEPRKNHVNLIAAFERVRRGGFGGPLVLVGQDGWLCRPILRRLDMSPERAAVIRLRDLDDRDLVALYGACTLCAFPSLEEGFGMPLIEAMACGAPCVTSDHPALLEVGAGYARTVPASDAGALADAIVTVWKDSSARDVAASAGPAQASAYRFDRWSERLLALYREELAAAR